MLTRWDPYREMMSMRRAMDRLIENTLGDNWGEGTSEWGLPLDVIENEEAFLIKASVPGIQPDNLEVTFNKGVLSIHGEIKDESEKQEGQYHLRERRFGSFSRSISLPVTVKSEDIQADFHDGILTLRLPKAEEVKPKRIQIQSKQKAIEGK